MYMLVLQAVIKVMFWFSNLYLHVFSLITNENAGLSHFHKGAVEGKNCMKAKHSRDSSNNQVMELSLSSTGISV